MKIQKKIFIDFFMAVGVVWFICAMSILLFNIDFQSEEIALTIIFPLAYTIFRQLGNDKPVNTSMPPPNYF